MGRPNRISNQTTKTFSERLSDLVEAEKKDTGKRQKEIAAAIGVSSGTLSEWCSDQKTPTIDALPKLSAYFNVSADWLIGISDAKSTDMSIQGAQRITGLSEAALKKLQKLNGFGSYYSETVVKLISEMLTDETLLPEIYRSFVAVWNIKNGKSTIGEEEESNIFTTKAGGIYVFGNDAVESILFSVQKDLVKFLGEFFMTE